MEAVSMQHIFVNGKINWFGIVLFAATILLLGFAIRQAYMQIKRMEIDEATQQRKLAELEINVRQIRGPQYQSITVPTNSIL